MVRWVDRSKLWSSQKVQSAFTKSGKRCMYINVPKKIIYYIPAIISFSITGSKKCPAEIIAFKGRPGSTKHSGLVWPMYCKRSLRLSKSSAASSKLGKTLACRCLKNLEKKFKINFASRRYFKKMAKVRPTVHYVCVH